MKPGPLRGVEQDLVMLRCVGVGRALIGAVLAVGCALSAAPVWSLAPVDALQRPAVQVREPARAVFQGVVRAGQRLVGVGERGLIAVSDDEGQTWRQVPVPVSASLTAVRFVSAQTGWAIGHYGVVLRSTDAGDTWVRQLDGREAAQKMRAAAQQRVAADPTLPSAQAQLREAERLVADGPDKPLLDLVFQDERVGFVVGAYNLMLRTDDGGQHWQAISERLDNPKGNHLYAISAQGRTLYVAGEAGVLFRSDDAGASFERLSLPYAGSLFNVTPLAGDGVLVSGLRGNAWLSADRGRSWQRLEGAPPVSFIAVVPGDEGQSPYLLNQAGQIYTVVGQQLQRLSMQPTPPVAGGLRLSRNRWLMLSMQGLIPLSAGGPQQ